MQSHRKWTQFKKDPSSSSSSNKTKQSLKETLEEELEVKVKWQSVFLQDCQVCVPGRSSRSVCLKDCQDVSCMRWTQKMNEDIIIIEREQGCLEGDMQ